MKHARPLLSMEESEKMLGLNVGTGITLSARELHNWNENKKFKIPKPKKNKKDENKCPYDNCVWANKITGICCMPSCMKKIFKNK